MHHYVVCMLEQRDLSQVKAGGLNETAAKRGHRYVTIFLDIQRKSEPIIFAIPGRGKATVKAFSKFLAAHQGDPQAVQWPTICRRPSPKAWKSTCPKPRSLSIGFISCRSSRAPLMRPGSGSRREQPPQKPLLGRPAQCRRWQPDGQPDRRAAE